ncbi:MAG: TIR domain-containing protein [Candidatus Thiodiazotropha sp.]
MSSRQFPDKFLVAFSFAGEQRNLVRTVAEAVENKLGPDTVFLDEWFEHAIAGDDADLKLLDIYGEKCVLVVVCISEQYGDKPWTQAEHAAIRSRVMKARESRLKQELNSILPIRVGDGEVKGIPFTTIAPDIRKKTTDEAAELIVKRLSLVAPEMETLNTTFTEDFEWLSSPPELLWPMANHSGVQNAFATLLTRSTTSRYLPIRGPSETGKSHMTHQMLANALQIPHLACGRFDFKGSTNMDQEVRAFVQELGVPVPPDSSLLNERLGNILDSLTNQRRPALLIFDTYEAAGKPQEDWVERELLIRLIRAPWFRVVIAGQRLPESHDAVWASIACATLDTKPPPPADWYDYGKKHNPELKLEEVETACKLAKEKASLLRSLLGPDN